MTARQKLFDVYAEKYEQLKGYAMSILNDEDKSFDIVQDLAVRICEMQSDLKIDNMSAFLFRITRNSSIDAIRKESRAVRTDPAIMDDFPESTYSHDYAHSDAKQWLEHYLASFTPEMREAFIRYVLDGDTVESIAKVMNIKAATLRQRFRRMRKSIPNDMLLFTMIIALIR
ncbi:MAG: RNA polymerase sigma factor [Clostridia bacterium]